MVSRRSIHVLSLLIASAAFSSQLGAQPGPPPGMRPPSPPPNSAPPPPSGGRVLGNHPANGVSAPIARLPGGARELRHRGSTVFHVNGKFYTPHGTGYRAIAAPVGLEISRLPMRARRVARDTYEHDGTFYEKTGLNQYRIIPAP